MNEQEAKQFILKAIEDSLRGIEFRIAKCPSLERLGDALRSEVSSVARQAGRLTKPAEADRFAGVKYVVTSEGDPRRLSTRAAWVAEHGERYAPPEGHDACFVQQPDGFEVWGRHGRYAPWHPQVGEKLRLEGEPDMIGTVVAICDSDLLPYRVQPQGGPASFCYALHELRPYAFAPPEPEPENQEFEDGNAIALFLAWARHDRKPRLLFCEEMPEGAERARFGQFWPLGQVAGIVEEYLQHARHIAGEAGNEPT